jgi:hypothetical protein
MAEHRTNRPRMRRVALAGPTAISSQKIASAAGEPSAAKERLANLLPKQAEPV